MKPHTHTPEFGRSMLHTGEAILESLVTAADRWMSAIAASFPAPGEKTHRPHRSGDTPGKHVTSKKRRHH